MRENSTRWLRDICGAVIIWGTKNMLCPVRQHKHTEEKKKETLWGVVRCNRKSQMNVGFKSWPCHLWASVCLWASHLNSLGFPHQQHDHCACTFVLRLWWGDSSQVHLALGKPSVSVSHCFLTILGKGRYDIWLFASLWALNSPINRSARPTPGPRNPFPSKAS